MATAEPPKAPKAVGLPKPVEVGIEPLIMVQDVSEDALDFYANALRYSDILLDAEVHIPVGQATDTASAAILGI